MDTRRSVRGGFGDRRRRSQDTGRRRSPPPPAPEEPIPYQPLRGSSRRRIAPFLAKTPAPTPAPTKFNLTKALEQLPYEKAPEQERPNITKEFPELKDLSEGVRLRSELTKRQVIKLDNMVLSQRVKKHLESKNISKADLNKVIINPELAETEQEREKIYDWLEKQDLKDYRKTEKGLATKEKKDRITYKLAKEMAGLAYEVAEEKEKGEGGSFDEEKRFRGYTPEYGNPGEKGYVPENTVFVSPDKKNVIVAYRGTVVKKQDTPDQAIFEGDQVPDTDIMLDMLEEGVNKFYKKLGFDWKKLTEKIRPKPTYDLLDNIFTQRLKKSEAQLKDIKKRFPDAKIHLVGHSLGGKVTKSMLARNPDDKKLFGYGFNAAHDQRFHDRQEKGEDKRYKGYRLVGENVGDWASVIGDGSYSNTKYLTPKKGVDYNLDSSLYHSLSAFPNVIPEREKGKYIKFLRDTIHKRTPKEHKYLKNKKYKKGEL